MFLWHLHQLKWKLMIVIMKLRIKSLPNLVGRKDACYFRVVRNPVLEVMLLDNNEPTSYGEVMEEWLEAIKSEKGSMYKRKYRL